MKGDPIGEGGAAFEAIRTEKTIVKEVPKEVYGIQFRSYAVPINVQELLLKNSNVIFMLNEANDNAKGTNDILNFVKGIASHTNILGMNAAIEAARAGEVGRGFKVVANEIRKLSNSTMNSLKQVNEVLENINSNIENISKDVVEANGVFEDQAASLEEISFSLQQLNETAKILEKLSKKL